MSRNEIGFERTIIGPKSILIALYVLVCLLVSLSFLTEYYIMAFAVILGLILVIMTFRNPFAGLIIYSVFFLVRPQEFVPGFVESTIPVERIFAVLMLASIALKNKLDHKKPFSLILIDYSFMVYVLVAFLSIFTAAWVTYAWDSWIKLLRLLIVHLLIANSIENKRQLKIFVIFMIMAEVFHGSAAIINYYRGIREFEMGIYRAVGLDLSYGDPNSLAPSMVYALPFVFYYFKSEKSLTVKTVLILFSLVLVWCVVLTGSRTGMAGVVFFAVLFLWRSRNKIRNFIILGICLALIWIIIPDDHKVRFESTTEILSSSGGDLSAQGRIEGLKNGFKMMLDRPFLGYGVGNFSIASGMIYGINYFEAHNLLGQLMGELGFLGLVSFGFFVFLIFKFLRAARLFYGRHNNIFELNTCIALELNLLLLLFMGMGGHNLYRYNWVLLSALTVVLTKLMAKTDTKAEGEQPGESMSC